MCGSPSFFFLLENGSGAVLASLSRANGMDGVGICPPAVSAGGGRRTPVGPRRGDEGEAAVAAFRLVCFFFSFAIAKPMEIDIASPVFPGTAAVEKEWR